MGLQNTIRIKSHKKYSKKNTLRNINMSPDFYEKIQDTIKYSFA